VYLVREGDSGAFDELLKRFEGPDLTWHKLRAEEVTSCDFTAVHNSGNVRRHKPAEKAF
jgi:hypothetical protein